MTLIDLVDRVPFHVWWPGDPRLICCRTCVRTSERGLETVGLRTRRLSDQKSVLVLHAVVLVLQVRCCVVKRDLVTLVVNDLEGHSNFSSTFYIVSIFCARNITTVEIKSGVHLLLKS